MVSPEWVKMNQNLNDGKGVEIVNTEKGSEVASLLAQWREILGVRA